MFAHNDKMIEMLKTVCKYEDVDMFSMVAGIVERELEPKYKLYTSAFNEIEKQAIADRYAIVEKVKDIVFNASSEKVAELVSRIAKKKEGDGVHEAVEKQESHIVTDKINSIFGVPLQQLNAVRLDGLEVNKFNEYVFHFTKENIINYFRNAKVVQCKAFKIIDSTHKSLYNGWNFSMKDGRSTLYVSKSLYENNNGNLIFASNHISSGMLCCVNDKFWVYDLSMKRGGYKYVAVPSGIKLSLIRRYEFGIYDLYGNVVIEGLRAYYAPSTKAFTLNDKMGNKIKEELQTRNLLSANVVIKLS